MADAFSAWKEGCVPAMCKACRADRYPRFLSHPNFSFPGKQSVTRSQPISGWWRSTPQPYEWTSPSWPESRSRSSSTQTQFQTPVLSTRTRKTFFFRSVGTFLCFSLSKPAQHQSPVACRAVFAWQSESPFLLLSLRPSEMIHDTGKSQIQRYERYKWQNALVWLQQSSLQPKALVKIKHVKCVARTVSSMASCKCTLHYDASASSLML